MSKLSEDRLKKLFAEIEMAEAYNKEELLPKINEAVSRYTNTYIPNIGQNWQVIINEFYPIIQFNLPNTFLNTPRAFLQPKQQYYITKRRDPVTGKKVDVQIKSVDSARTQEAIINYNLQEMKYKLELRKVSMDALMFPHAIMWHGYKGNFGMTAEEEIFIRDEKTFVKHIPPMEFLKDPLVAFSDVETGQWVARIINIPYRDLVEDDELKVDKKLIKGFKGYGTRIGAGTAIAKGGGDTKTVGQYYKPLLDSANGEFRNSQDALFVKCYEVFLKPTKKEKRENKPGKILLLTNEQKTPLRESGWTIKAEGFPSKVLEFNHVPGCILGMPDIDTYKSSVDQKNAIINLQLRNATENSKVWVAIATGEGFDGEEDIEKIKQGDQTILSFKSDTVQGKMQLASPSGMASSELYLIDGRIQRNIENLSGVSDLKKGFLQSGEESATSVKIRNAGSSARPAYRQDIMSDFLKESIHYLLQLEKQFTTIKEAVRIVGTLDLQWSDTPTKEDIQADVDVDIDVVSMLPEDPERELRNLQQTMAFFTQALQSPAVMQKIMQEGKILNLSPLIQQIFMRMKLKDPDIFRSIKQNEQMGFVSKQQLQEAEQNVISAITKGQIAIPPKESDDHKVKLEIYSVFNGLLEALGQESQVLKQLIMLQQDLIQQLEAKEGGNERQININKEPNIQPV